ncbi:MAG TPA: glycogen debranching enzyme GlgX, partial [Actinomycetota bacterium]|nr:glycogen debranching enzyme GlgX [Actinomycetota bacterium]
MRPGAQPPPLGAHPVGDGVSFSVFSRNASAVDVCLFDESGAESRLRAERVESDVWHVVVKGATLGTPYGFRAEGPMDAAGGHRFDASKLLADPYARRIDGEVLWDDAILMPKVDSAPFVPRCVVEDGSFDWANESQPRT